ncbi:hypothetical protein GobsT_65500 [Gemmata obscuriglobus]|uniref:Lipoprotein n=1 Tax=Gemmata obscuriglobus TaxID=114 RepID=A0A2Z3GVT9_9BACT|nr:hypothetical protein [Gemmata obscuriglobus]AWM35757.1 hypothetical protein C1280_01100 [Gemmata obscuriglobus]QEG31706.1 hypothetical protein GobsT_65500 [Gemmata obscuriglobus]VTS11052.1 unnamed protein product [Gemmata obscuriglobus UQM 2246]
MRALIALVVACAAIGCHHDKYDVRRPKVEEYYDPPNEPRYNEPDKATYRPPPAQKKEENLRDRNKGGPGGGPGGF